MSKEKLLKRNAKVVNRFIRGWLAKKKVGIVHGGRAQNAQLPQFLERRSTKDWDVFVRKPKTRAQQLEKVLDKRFRGDVFKVKKGATKRLKVHKVVDNFQGESVADFSIPDRMVPWKPIRGVKFATLKDQKEKALRTIKKPEAQFRKAKDLDFLRRVRKFEKIRGKKI